MSEQDVRRRLVDFLDEKAFGPVLKADPREYPPEKHADLAEVQRMAQRERERFHACRSANEVYRFFEAYLSSDEAKELYHKLRDLNLPTLADIQIDFEQMSQDLGLGLGRDAAP